MFRCRDIFGQRSKSVEAVFAPSQRGEGGVNARQSSGHIFKYQSQVNMCLSLVEICAAISESRRRKKEEEKEKTPAVKYEPFGCRAG